MTVVVMTIRAIKAVISNEKAFKRESRAGIHETTGAKRQFNNSQSLGEYFVSRQVLDGISA
jgi:hypothetical protein